MPGKTISGQATPLYCVALPEHLGSSVLEAVSYFLDLFLGTFPSKSERQAWWRQAVFWEQETPAQSKEDRNTTTRDLKLTVKKKKGTAGSLS